MASIRNGPNLRKAEPARSPTPPDDSRGGLLASIRQGGNLKKAEPVVREEAPAPTDGNLADLLRNALSNRIKAVAGSGADLFDVDSEEEESDGEW